MKLLDGKKVSQEIKNHIKAEINNLKSHQRKPKLAVIIVGNDHASELYVKNKLKACQEVGIIGEKISFPATVNEDELITTINKLNNDNTIDGILIQLPLAQHLNELKVLNTIAVNKDVDGLTALSAGKLLQGDNSALIPCTVKGIIKLLDYYQIPIAKQNITIINNSNIVGKPLAMILNNMGATVSLAHKLTKDLNAYLHDADIIFTATGVYNLFTVEQVKKDCIIVDIAINNIAGKKLVGDVDFISMKDKVKAITPVPGGVGPMTIAMLLDNLMTIFNSK